MTAFSTVISIQATPLSPQAAAAAELRRFIATKRERHSENASRLREWVETISNERGQGSQAER